jgi:hypothetical protein
MKKKSIRFNPFFTWVSPYLNSYGESFDSASSINMRILYLLFFVLSGDLYYSLVGLFSICYKQYKSVLLDYVGFNLLFNEYE